MLVDPAFWEGKRVFLTGHTGFKGSWLSLWLHSLGARVTGYALAPPTEPNHFRLSGVDKLLNSRICDIRDPAALNTSMKEAAPEIVIHMAAQSLVRNSYLSPAETYETNVMGTVNLFEAVRQTPGISAVLNVTTDKCYENSESGRPFKEDEALGGYDPYSSSKACSELVTAAYRRSFFNPEDYGDHGVAVATARAGNVIGGGDWAKDRLIPDCVRAAERREKFTLRNPEALRPWQHVLDPLNGYLILAQKLVEDGPPYAEAWNFGPDSSENATVRLVVEKLQQVWERVDFACSVVSNAPHEASQLMLDSGKSRQKLGWEPIYSLDESIGQTAQWYRNFYDRNKVISLQQLDAYLELAKKAERARSAG